MNYLNSYLRSKLDLSRIGFLRRKDEEGYFCTPVLSKIIGWAGVDGIHFCTTKGFDEIIFAVSPMNTPGNYVHPVARSFDDFLRLILACYDTAAIEQCWFMARDVFENFLAENQPTSEAPKTHMAMSSLRFEPMNEIEWRIVFQEKPNEDFTVSLVLPQ